jgi:hypothetical protein
MNYTEIRLLNGDAFTVEGALDEVEKVLSGAARSGQGRMAWFEQRGADDAVALNPAHVAAMRTSENSD